ncbi:MAG: GntR family transcriptional regulator [Novosphingobium sp.]|nr:GntR family transcriptional regulator [Novosphingobium sp.]
MTGTGQSGGQSGGPPRQTKIANAVAASIEKEIVAGRYAVGSSIGNEADLCERYGVSRWAIREAIAIVQNDGLIAVKRGRGGGALVNSTPENSLAAAICGFLLHARLENAQIIQARLAIDSLLYRTAAARFDRPVTAAAFAMAGEAKDDRDATTVASEILDVIVGLADNPLIGVFALALSKLTLCRLAMGGYPVGEDAGLSLSSQLLSLRKRQLSAIIAVDADAAVAAGAEMAKLWRPLFADLDDAALRTSFEDRQAAAFRIAQILHPGQSIKPAGTVSTLLMFDAMQLDPSAKGFIGSEAALTARYKVPRNLLREGVRILERDGFLRSEPGRTGGIRIGEPDMALLIERAVRIFEFCGIGIEQVDAFALQIRLHAMDCVFARGDAPARLAERLAAISDADLPSAKVFSLIAAHSDNCLVMLAEAICQRLRPDAGERVKNTLLENLKNTLHARKTGRSRRILARMA